MTSARKAAGFTLIEILVTVVIIAIIVSAAVLSLGVVDDDREVREEGRRFGALLELALDDAALQGREFGIELMRGGYRFVEYDTLTGVWMEIPFDDVLRHRSLPEEMEIELYLEDKRILLDDDPAEFEDADELGFTGTTERYAPHLLLYSSGDVTPFELHILRDYDDRRIVVNVDALGAISFGNEDET